MTQSDRDARRPPQEPSQRLPFLLLSALSVLLSGALADRAYCYSRLKWNSHPTMINVEFSTEVLLTFNAPTLVECSVACDSASACCTFSYNADTTACQMHRMSLDEVDPGTLVQSLGTRLYSVEGTCCSPPSIRLATPTFSFGDTTPAAPYPPGTEVDYRCNNLFSFFGDPRTCQKNSSWSGTPGLCGRTKYIFQAAINFGGRFPQPVVPGVKTVVTGIFGNELLEIIYREDTRNSPLNLKFHLSAFGDTRFVRMGILTNDVFTELSSSSDFPFEANQPFNVTVVVRETDAQIIIDDNPWGTFTYSSSKPVIASQTMYLNTDSYLDTIWFVYPNGK